MEIGFGGLFPTVWTVEFPMVQSEHIARVPNRPDGRGDAALATAAASGVPAAVGTDARASESRPMRDRLLDAAEDVLSTGGATTLTLEAVATAAGVSKGGLLHHFGTKDLLVIAMAQRAAAEWHAEVCAAIERVPPGPGRVSRALLQTCAASGEAWNERIRRRSAALFAVLLHRPELIAELKSPCEEVRCWLANDGLAEGVSDAVMAAIDGLWMYWVTGLVTLDEALLRRVRLGLERLIAAGGGGGGVEASGGLG